MGFATELQDACGKLDRRDITRDAFIAACNRLTVRHVGCERAGIWTFLEATDGPVQHCLGVFDATVEQDFKVPEFWVGLGVLVDALRRDGHVVADDVRTHPATAVWWAGHPNHYGIESLMAASFSVNGRLSGMFTCSHVDRTSRWTAAQLAVLKRVAVRASLSLASATSFTLATMPTPLVDLPPLEPPRSGRPDD